MHGRISLHICWQFIHRKISTRGGTSLLLEEIPPRAGKMSAQPTKGARLREKKVLSAARRMRCRRTYNFLTTLWLTTILDVANTHEKAIAFRFSTSSVTTCGRATFPSEGKACGDSAFVKLSVLSSGRQKPPSDEGGGFLRSKKTEGEKNWLALLISVILICM